MGVVYKARDPLIGRLVAMKTITSGLADQPEMLERFYREAQAAGGLAHPNIVTIYDLGKEQNTPYIAMEFLEGISLEKIIDEHHAMPMSQKIGYIVQVCRALEYAHKRGVVHRDIKPANIVVIQDGTIKVVDFGIARLVDTSRSQTGLLIGTVNYMSPEQVRGERVDGRSDIFSVGVMFYELLSYERPFTGSNFTAVMLAIITQEPPSIREKVPDVPPEIEAVIQKILRKDANERYQAMDDVLLDLEPVWRKLQTESVSLMVAESQKLIADKDLEKARDVLRQALLIDTTHKEAKTLLEKVNAELRRSLVVPKLQEIVAKGQDLLKQGKVAEAKVEAENALKLDTKFEPAKELMKQVQAETERRQLVKEWITNSQARMAEGNLTAADQQLDKLLEVEPRNPQAQKLKKQIAEERERRAKRQRLLDTMQQARGLWTQQKFDECIVVLESLKKDFPEEGEIDKLLETVRADKAEQEKHEKLGQARKLLGEQKFAESLSVLDSLLDRYPNETGIQKMRSVVVEERKEHARRVRLQHEQQALKKLVNEEKYPAAIEKGESLLKEFPEDFELTRMVEFARNQQAYIEQQRRMAEKAKELNDLVDKKEYAQAVTAAEKALETFPGNLEFRRTLEEAKTRQAEKEKKEYVEKQIRAIKASIDKGNLTEAIDVGRQTLAQVKHDTDVTRLLHFAEREHQLREQSRQHEDQLKTAVFMMNEQRFDEAAKVLEDVKKTVVFDPRVHSLLEAAKAKQAPSEEMQKTIVAQPGVTPEQQYVLQTTGAAAPAEEAAQPAMKAQAPTPAVEPAKPVPPPPAPEKAAAPEPVPAKPEVIPPPPPPKPPVKGKPAVEEAPPKKKEKGKPAVEPPPPPKVEPPKVEPPPPPPPVKAKPAVEEKPAPLPPKVEPPKPAVEKPAEKAKLAVEAPPPPKPAPPPPPKVEAPAPPKPAPPVEKAKPAVEAPPLPRPAPARVEVPAEVVAEAKPIWKNPIVMGVAGLIVVAVIVILVMSGGKTGEVAGPGSETTTTTGTSGPSESSLQSAAQKLVAEHRIDDAIAKYNELVGLNGSMKNSAQQEVTRLQKLRGDEDKLWGEADAAQKAKKWPDATAKYNEIVKLGGQRSAAATQALKIVEARAAGKSEEQAESEQFRAAQQLMQRKDYEKARAAFQQVIALNVPNSKLKSQAETQMSLAESRLNEKKAFDDAVTLQSSNQLQQARAKFQDVVNMNGEFKSQAQSKIQEIDTAVTRSNALAQLNQQAEAALNSGNYAEARNKAREITQSGGDGSAVTNRANQAEEQKFNNAKNAFDSAKSSGNESALGSVETEMNAIARGNGPLASQARNYVDSLIPTARTEIRANRSRADANAKAEAEDREFNDLVGRYNRAESAKDSAALDALKADFERVGRSASSHAAEARSYVTSKIPNALSTLKPCPEIRNVGTGLTPMTPTPQAGATVNVGLLDAGFTWRSCVWPQVSATVMVTATVDENGNVIDVKPRGPKAAQFDAAAAAVKQWKATPPTSKGVKVKTDVGLDIKP